MQRIVRFVHLCIFLPTVFIFEMRNLHCIKSHLHDSAKKKTHTHTHTNACIYEWEENRVRTSVKKGKLDIYMNEQIHIFFQLLFVTAMLKKM